MTSYKSKIYTTLGTPTNIEGNVVSANNSSGVPAKDYTVKGKTIVWNQLLDKSKYSATTTTSGVTFTNNGDGSITVNGTASSTANAGFNVEKNISVIQGHKYYVTMSKPIEHNNFWFGLYTDSGDQPFQGATILERNGRILDCAASSDGVNCTITLYKNKSVSNAVVKPQLFDLTQMFGAGNEPATPEEFRAMFPDDYYTYNAGELKTIVPTSVESKNQSGETLSVNIPSSKYFPDGMRSAGAAYDEINFLSQKAIKRIGSVDMGTLNWSSQQNYNSFIAKVNGFIQSNSQGYDYGLFCARYPSSNFWWAESKKPNKTISHAAANIIAIKDSDYTDAVAFKTAMSGVMLYYALATPVETEITPPLQALTTYKGFTSFSAPNSLTQNGPLSVTYYAEGGANPESGWLTSYKRKLYMGRNIEWNQLFTNSMTSSYGVTISNNQDGTMTLNGTANKSYINFTNLSDAMNQVHKYLLCLKILNNPDNVSFSYGWLNRSGMRTGIISKGESCAICNQTEPMTQGEKVNGLSGFAAGTVFNNVKIAAMVMDLTQMFGTGNEPTTPEEFWSYFDHKLYPYNAGETQPLFKISRKRLIK